jgi:hypothetical protein
MWPLLILLAVVLIALAIKIKGCWFAKLGNSNPFEIVINNTPPPNELIDPDPTPPPSDSIKVDPILPSKGTTDPQITVQWR